MTEEKQAPPGNGFRWPVFVGVVLSVVLLLLAIYLFVYLRVGT